MKLYNKKKIITAIVEFSLATASIVTIVIQKSYDIKFIFLSLICLLMSLYSCTRAFSKQKAYEDLIEDLDERDNMIAMTVNDKMLRVFSMIVVIFIIFGIIVYSITKNINIIIAILPLMIMLLLAFFLYIILYLYYEKKM